MERVKDEKWPATEPGAIHQDVTFGLRPARNPHLGRLKKKKKTNRAQTKRAMERNQKGDVIELQCQMCSSLEGLSPQGSGFIMDFWSRSGFIKSLGIAASKEGNLSRVYYPC